MSSGSQIHPVDRHGNYEMSQVLGMGEYTFWLEALENDDYSTVETTLSESEPEERERLLNGTFNVEKTISSQTVGARGSNCLRLSRPWNICAARGAHTSMALMLSYGVDVHQKDDNDNNVLHTLVLIAYLEPSLEARMEDTYRYIEQLLDKTTLKELLFSSENHYKYRPLELAAHLGALRLFRAIFETEGVYVFTEQFNSLYSINWYDVSDYEGIASGSRRWASPLLFLMLIDEDKVADRITSELFASAPIINWTKLKMKSNNIFIILWFITRIIYSVAYIITDASYVPAGLRFSPNNTANDTVPPATVSTCVVRTSFVTDRHHVYLFLLVYLAVHSLTIVIFDIYETIFSLVRNLHKIIITPKGYKQPAVNYIFYRLLQFLLALFILLGEVSNVTTVVLGRGLPTTVYNLMYICVSMGLVWSNLFFVQLLPWIGHFVQAVQGMVMKLFKFSLVFFFFTMPFVGAFKHLVNTGSTKDCPAEFRTLGESFYSVFMVMLNMVDFRRFAIAEPTALYILHIIYVFVTSILLINFLVALFSGSFGHVYDNQHVLSTLQRISVVWLIEDRISTCCSSWYSRFYGRYFPVKDGRIMVPCITLNKNLMKKASEERTSSAKVWAKKKRQFTSYMIR